MGEAFKVSWLVIKILMTTRDLVVNNDHIHCVEQRMQLAIEQGLSQR